MLRAPARPSAAHLLSNCRLSRCPQPLPLRRFMMPLLSQQSHKSSSAETHNPLTTPYVDQVCKDSINEEYSAKDVGAPMMPIYRQLIESGKIRILVYSGDDDAICATAGAQLWVWDMGEPTEAWKPWYSHGQVAGYTVEFPGMRFSTVHGAGHMVPSTRPQQAFDMFSKFLEQKPW